jgi:hypothetical protein
MRKIQDETLSFRLTRGLRKQLTNFCEEHDFHSSFVVRQALGHYLQRVREAGPLPRLGGGWKEDHKVSE